MRQVFIVLLTFILYTSGAQTLQERELPLKFGLAPTLYLPQNPSQFENRVSVSPAAFISYKYPSLSVLGRIGYRAINYTNLDTRSEVQAHELLGQFGLKLNHPEVQNTNLVLAYTPNFVVAAELVTVGKSISLTPVKDFVKEYTTPLHHALYSGIELELSSRNSLELGFSQSFNRKSTDLFVNGSPSAISLTYSINFNLKDKNSYKAEVVKSLRELSQKGTLYVINRTCESDFTNAELDSLWAANYTFSDYKIVNDEDVAEVMKSKKPFFFAVMGKYYASLGDPATTGIYLLDRTASHLRKPYPLFTPIHNGNSYCIGSEQNAAKGIRAFSASLKVR